MAERVYLDNAATSWPKPEAVYAAVDDYQRRLGAPAGRSGYAQAVEVARLVDQARRAVAELLGADRPEHVLFTANGTDALNLALHGLLQPGDHVVTSDAEHNSVLRPLADLQLRRAVRVTRVRVDRCGQVDPRAIAAAIEPSTRLIALIHASNVTGAVQDLAAVARIASDASRLLLVDAAQTAGQLPIDVQQLGVDLLAAPGHKSLLGPLGTGVLYVRPGLERLLAPLRQGGTGSQSERDQQPDWLPDKYEAGNLNVPGIVGLGAGVRTLLAEGVAAIGEHHQQRLATLRAGLQQIPGVTLYGPPDARRSVGIVSLTLDGYDPQVLASLLDGQFSIQGRAGLHCAPRIHKALGTTAGGGTFRLSVGPFTTADDVLRTIESVRELAHAAAT